MLLRHFTENAFLELTLDGERLVRRYGRLDTPGKSFARTFPNDRAARRALWRAFWRAIIGGYDPGWSDPTLVRKIAEAPDDPSNYLVYADWLSERGDPRGELIAVQHALEDAPSERRPDLEERQTVLLATNPYLFGTWPDMRLVWFNGFVRHVSVTFPEADHRRLRRLQTWMKRLAFHPTGRFLRTIEIRLGFDGQVPWTAAYTRAGSAANYFVTRLMEPLEIRSYKDLFRFPQTLEHVDVIGSAELFDAYESWRRLAIAEDRERRVSITFRHASTP